MEKIVKQRSYYENLKNVEVVHVSFSFILDIQVSKNVDPQTCINLIR